jgi:hypothetical protein
MIRRKMTKRQVMIYKTLHRKLKIEQHEPHKTGVRVSSSCATGGTHCVLDIVENGVKRQ